MAKWEDFSNVNLINLGKEGISRNLFIFAFKDMIQLNSVILLTLLVWYKSWMIYFCTQFQIIGSVALEYKQFLPRFSG